ncbi:MAG: D-alanyl-D-alanine dipeptidase [Azospirillaceae bacterium]|nr:D-alanyl-D-alanine dipeptidase [Azospirillaceae bacterium]
MFESRRVSDPATDSLVEITADWPVTIDLRYAGDNNLTGRPLYQRSLCLLHAHAAAALRRAAVLARHQDLTLCILDAFRPVEAQWRLWHAAPDPRFVADPRLGSHHSRGVAVDLTLQDTAGRLLDMGTAFDDMTPEAHHGAVTVSVQAQRHRSQLLGLMAAAGWRHYSYEWWHYELPAAATYPLWSDSAIGNRLMSAVS